MLQDREARLLDGGADLVLPPLDDAGADPDPAGRQEGTHQAREGNDHVRDDVGQHQIIAPAEAAAQGGVREDVAGADLEPVRAEAD